MSQDENYYYYSGNYHEYDSADQGEEGSPAGGSTGQKA